MVVHYRGFNPDLGTNQAVCGSLWMTGANTNGQLGSGNTTGRSSWAQVGSDTNWIDVQTGQDYTIAIKNDGTMWGTGNNATGQLGTGNTTSVSTLTQLGVGYSWRQVACSCDGSSFALRSDGTLWCTGSNSHYQLCQGDNTNRSSWTQIGSGDGFNYISVGASHGLVVKNDNTMWTFGANTYGQSGLGTTSPDTSLLTQVGSLQDWLNGIACANANMYVKIDGTIWGNGQNTYGQLGTGNTTSVSSPVQAGSNDTWLQVAFGYNFNTYAIDRNNTIYFCGYAQNGASGLGNTTNYSVLTQIGALANWAYVVAGNAFALALKTDGTMWGWGYNNVGQYGTNNKTSYSSPVQIGTSNRWLFIDAYNTHSAGIIAP